jgi:hypothetical protein
LAHIADHHLDICYRDYYNTYELKYQLQFVFYRHFIAKYTSAVVSTTGRNGGRSMFRNLMPTKYKLNLIF